MPYKVVAKEDHYAVVNTDTNDVVDTHDERPDAERQVRILNKLEDEGEDDE
jgi:hypothetical protein